MKNNILNNEKNFWDNPIIQQGVSYFPIKLQEHNLYMKIEKEKKNV